MKRDGCTLPKCAVEQTGKALEFGTDFTLKTNVDFSCPVIHLCMTYIANSWLIIWKYCK